MVEAKIRIVGVLNTRETTLTFFVIYLYPLKPNSSAGHTSHTVWDNLMIFGRNIYQVKYKYRMQKGRFLLGLSSGYLP